MAEVLTLQWFKFGSDNVSNNRIKGNSYADIRNALVTNFKNQTLENESSIVANSTVVLDFMDNAIVNNSQLEILAPNDININNSIFKNDSNVTLNNYGGEQITASDFESLTFSLEAEAVTSGNQSSGFSNLPKSYPITSLITTIDLNLYQQYGIINIYIAPWDELVTYSIDNLAINGTGFVYKSKTNSNLNNALTDPVNWEYVDAGSGDLGALEITDFVNLNPKTPVKIYTNCNLMLQSGATTSLSAALPAEIFPNDFIELQVIDNIVYQINGENYAT